MAEMLDYIRYQGCLYRAVAEKKTLLITDSDMDGSCCAIMVLQRWPSADVEYESHKTVVDRVRRLSENSEGYGRVLIADMLPDDEKLVRRLHADFPGEVRIFDHHETQEYLNELDGCRHDKGACSGLICAQELGVPEDHLAFAEIVDAWDRFQDGSDKFEDAKRLMMFHNFIGQESFVKRAAKAELDENERKIVEQLDRAEKQQIDESLENLRRFRDPEGQIFAMVIGVNSPLMFSSASIAHAIYESDNQIDYVAVWHPGSGSVSLYSRKGGFDVSEVARSRGGGGHAGAAGFAPDVDLSRLIARELFGKRS